MLATLRLVTAYVALPLFRIAGKTIQMSDLHMCNDHEVGLANFIKIQVEKEEKKDLEKHL
jgi:hypothetical protein